MTTINRLIISVATFSIVISGASFAQDIESQPLYVKVDCMKSTSADYTIENMEGVHAAHPDKPVAILEAGWATVAIEFGDRANEADQARYYRELKDWATKSNATVFFFEAFDEPWKGDPAVPLGAEKHWGIFNVDRTPKQVLK